MPSGDAGEGVAGGGDRSDVCHALSPTQAGGSPLRATVRRGEGPAGAPEAAQAVWESYLQVTCKPPSGDPDFP